MIVDLYNIEKGECRVIGTVTFENGKLTASGYGLQLIKQPLLRCRDWADMEGGFDIDPQKEPERFMKELPTMFRGGLRAIVREEGRAVAASLEASQLPPDAYDGLTGLDLMAKRPSFHESFRKLMAEADAEYADEDAAIARGDLVPTPDGRLLPAGDPALAPGYKPPRPPTVALVAQTRGVVLSLAVYPDQEKLVVCDGSSGIQVLDLRSGQELCRRENVPSPIDRLAVSPDGLRVVGIDRGGSVFAWDAQSLMPVVEAAPLERYAALLGRATEVRNQNFSVFTKSGVEIYEDGGKVCARWPNQGPIVVLLPRARTLDSACHIG